MTVSNTEDSMSKRLHERGRSVWEAAHRHPMISDIASGRLPHEVFRFYFAQNIMYLEEYARSIAFVIAKAPDVEAIVVLNRFLAQIAEHEIPANHEFLRRLGGEPLARALDDMTSVNYNYTRHLLYATSQLSPAAGLAALLPCQWSYGEIATRLVAKKPDDPIYADWIALFANPAYDELVADSVSLLDRMAEHELVSVEDIAPLFDRSSQYELAFWQMAYTQGKDDVASPVDRSAAHEGHHS